MSLREILQGLAGKEEKITLTKGNEEFDAASLLNNLPESKLNRKAHIQPGLYIAEINDSGYMGAILYKFKR